MPRPKINNPRTKVLRVRITEAEHRVITQRAKKQKSKEATIAYELLQESSLPDMVRADAATASQLSTTTV